MVWREIEEASLATSLSKNTGNLQLNPIIESFELAENYKNNPNNKQATQSVDHIVTKFIAGNC